MPAGIAEIVDQLIVRIPAEHDVAEAETTFEGREELVARDIFAAHYPVNVDEAELDMAEGARLDDPLGIGSCFYVSCLHLPPPGIW